MGRLGPEMMRRCWLSGVSSLFFYADVGHLRLSEEEGLIQILRETLTVSYSRWIREVRESIRTSDSNGGRSLIFFFHGPHALFPPAS